MMIRKIAYSIAAAAIAASIPFATANADGVTHGSYSLNDSDPLVNPGTPENDNVSSTRRDTSQAGYPVPAARAERPQAGISRVKRDTANEGYPFPRKK